MPYIGYTFIIIVCIYVILAILGTIKEKYFPYLLYAAAAGMVLMTTLAGPYLIGSDIHIEYYYAQLHAGGNVIPPITPMAQGASILTYGPPSIWAYKLLYPLIFSLLPVILYFLYRRWLDNKQAFLASLLVISFPAFFLELPTIPKQMIAEVCLVLSIFWMFKANWAPKYKYPLIGILGALMPLLHYSIGVIALIVMFMVLIVGSILRQGVWKPVIISLISLIIVGSIFFTQAQDGFIAWKLKITYNNFVPAVLQIPPYIFEEPEGTIIKPDETPPTPTHPTEPKQPFIERYETLLQIGLGADFLDVDIPSKIFRVLQWAVLILLAIGLIKMRKLKSYLVCASGFILILLLCVIPGWSSTLNISRFLHIGLLVLAPGFAMVVKPKYLLILFIPYFLFTSGFIFEVTRQPNLETITVPYNIGLSNHRIDMGASLTQDDIKAVDYIIDNELYPIHSDLHGAYYIIERMGNRPNLNQVLGKVFKPLEGGYVFVRERNIQDGTFTIWWGIGQRKFIPIETFDVDINKNIVFQSGDARILEVN